MREDEVSIRDNIILRWVAAIGLILWFPFRFYWDILHYQPHSDDLLGVLLALPCAVICVTGFIWALKWDAKRLAVAYGLALASCVFFTYLIFRIPLCSFCDGTTEENLGFMLRPFADTFLGQ